MASVYRRSLFAFVALVLVVGGVVTVSHAASAAGSTPVVYVATGENFPDALGAASAAAVQGGPVLLVQKNSIPGETKAELTRLSPDVIYVAGGIAVVSPSVVDELKSYAPTVTRLAGLNRYATAVEVSKSAFPVSGGGSTALEARVTALEAQVAQLEALLSGVSRNGDVLMFEGMNLQVVNGSGSTNGSPNGLGNIMIGYNADDPAVFGVADRTGSHYLIVGDEHSWTSSSGINIGYGNTTSGVASSVSGGRDNTASGSYSSVSGGYGNTTSGFASSVSGGRDNTASGHYSSVSGGYTNTASGSDSSVSGGYDNTASGGDSSVSGGRDNTASGLRSSVSGGPGNTASGVSSSVSGGYGNTASGSDSSVSGGYTNTAAGSWASVSGGSTGTASGTHASISGGFSNSVSADIYYGSVLGGDSNTASANAASVVGGRYNTASGSFSSILGGESLALSISAGTYPYCGCTP